MQRGDTLCVYYKKFDHTMKPCIPLLFFACFVLLTTGHAQPARRRDALPDSFIYRQVDDVSLKAYVFKPANSRNHRPAILMFHGGAWRLGDASWMFDRARLFADK